MSPQTSGVFEKLLAFLNRLENGDFWYKIVHVREETVTVMVWVPGQIWEVEFFEDGHIEFERFFSSGDIFDEDVLEAELNAIEVLDKQDSEN